MTRSLNKQDKLGQEGEKLGDEIRVNGEKHVHFINHRKNFEWVQRQLKFLWYEEMCILTGSFCLFLKLRMGYIHIKEKEGDYCHSLHEAGSQLGTLDEGHIGGDGGFILRKNWQHWLRDWMRDGGEGKDCLYNVLSEQLQCTSGHYQKW